MNTMWQQHRLSIVAGLLSGMFFFLIAAGEAGSGPSIYLPAFPLLLLALWGGMQKLAIATAISMTIALFLTGPLPAALHALLSLFPVMQFMRHCLKNKVLPDGVRWYPMGQILMNLTFYAIGLYLLLCLAMSDQGGIHVALQKMMQEIIKEVPEGLRTTGEALTGKWLFFYPPFYAWLWVICFYGVAVLANYILKELNYNQRDSLALQPFIAPLWTLIGLLIAALTFIFGTGEAAFIGKSTFIMLLLPYFLSGIAQMHARAKQIPNGKLWVIAAYLLLLLAFWPAIVLILFGIFKQLQFWFGGPRQADPQA